MKLADNKATLSFSNGSPSVDLPVYQGTVGPDVVDIRKLYAQTGMFTYDPGFLSTASCQSAITYIDGDKGELLYRGYPIEQLATNCDFLETCHLLLYGELPDGNQKKDFTARVTNHTMVNEQMQFFLRGFRRDAHPMAIMTGLVGALSAFYHDSTDINNPEHREIAAIRLIAKMPTLVAMAYKYTVGQPYMYPRNDLSYAGNFLHMMFATPCEEYKVNPVLERAMDRIFTLHADHEQNASTSTVRLCGSSGTNPFAAIAAGVACLWGPAHGGANEACLNMLEDIQRQGGIAKVGEFMEKVKDKYVWRQADGFWPPRVQELRSPRQAHAGNLQRGAGRTGTGKRSPVQAGQRGRKDCAGRRLFRLPQALPQRGLLLRHRAARHRHPRAAVHRDLLAGPHRGLDRPAERNDQRSRVQDWPSTPAVYGFNPA